MKLFALCVCIVTLSACASYVVPGGPVALESIDRTDIASIAARRPAAAFPAHLAVVRVQAPTYRSNTAAVFGRGNFVVLSSGELISEPQMDAIGRWPGVAAVAPVSRLLLTERLESIDDLRLAAAKLQADIVAVYTIDTSFNVQGRAYGPLSVISLGLVPDRDAHITSTASAVFTDVKTGYTYGVAEATAKTSGLTNAWDRRDTIDRKRVEAEQQAFGQLLVEAEKVWRAIAARSAAVASN